MRVTNHNNYELVAKIKETTEKSSTTTREMEGELLLIITNEKKSLCVYGRLQFVVVSAESARERRDFFVQHS